MVSNVAEIASSIRERKAALYREMRERRRRWGYRVRRRRVWFDLEVRRAHKQLKQSVPAFLWQGSLWNLLTAPLTYSLGVPLLLLDAWVTVYQWVCFPIYGIERVPRRRYFVIDRHKLAYLNAIEKAHCFYCSYATGLIGYVLEIAARTEQYWCPIRHSRVFPAPHAHYQSFFDYGDAAGYRQGLPAVRRALRHEPNTRRLPKPPDRIAR
jgi:hypothetical protein